MVSIEVLMAASLVLMVILFPLALSVVMALFYDESAEQTPEESG